MFGGKASGSWAVPGNGPSLHVYRLSAADWLVSEVGRGNEGRGTDLTLALAALSAGLPSPGWWSVVPEALFGDNGSPA